MRDAFSVLIQSTSDNRVTSRLTQLMTRTQNQDTTSARAEGKVSVGILTPECCNDAYPMLGF